MNDVKATSSRSWNSSLEVDEQCHADHDQDERDDPAGNECDLDVRRRSVFAIRSDLLQSCRLLARMPNETFDFGRDDLAELDLVRVPSASCSNSPMRAAVLIQSRPVCCTTCRHRFRRSQAIESR